MRLSYCWIWSRYWW